MTKKTKKKQREKARTRQRKGGEMKSLRESGHVKSAGRAVEVFDLFFRRRQPLTIMEIARELAWPQSSASEILQTLVISGYVNHDRNQRTYFPSIRLAIVGEWVQESPFVGGGITGLMAELGRLTGDTIILGTRDGTFVEVLNTLPSVTALKRHTSRGDRRVITRTALGHTLLASYDNNFVEMLVRRVNANTPLHEERVRFSELAPILSEIRRLGYCYTDKGAVPDAAIVAMLLPTRSHEDRLVIGVAAPADDMRPRKDDVARIMRNTIDEFLGRQGLKILVDRPYLVQDAADLSFKNVGAH
jgi:IclR family KDG regulon transcriptional repressor